MLLRNVLRNNPKSMSEYRSIQGGYKRASVALVLRPQAASPERRGTLPRFSSLSALKSQPHDLLQAEILMIKRALNPNDVWSGDIALPGGRQQPCDDSDLHTVTRECLEETGVDLNSDRFQYVGRLDDRKARGRPLVISTFVFASTDDSDIPFRLQENEVAEAFWVPSSLFHDESEETVVSELPLPVMPRRLPTWTKQLLGYLGIHTMYFPCVYLREHANPAYAVWGLTFGILSDFFRTAGFSGLNTSKVKTISGQVKRPLLPFRTNNTVGDAVIFCYLHSKKLASAFVLALTMHWTRAWNKQLNRSKL